MLIACAMCGGVMEAAVPVALASASLLATEIYNRARLAPHNAAARQAARLARIVGADKLAADIPPAARLAEQSAKLRRDRRELAAS